MQLKTAVAALGLIGCHFGMPAAAAPPSIEDFAREPQIFDAALSPDGR